ncbi:hypothetical protein, partial [Dyadobacter tibetensis]|uniref:hypothetical protein n=2 Tax=Dyadobacter tibetensis TaxID=1211851 RepID=UPI00046E54D2
MNTIFKIYQTKFLVILLLMATLLCNTTETFAQTCTHMTTGTSATGVNVTAVNGEGVLQVHRSANYCGTVSSGESFNMTGEGFGQGQVRPTAYTLTFGQSITSITLDIGKIGDGSPETITFNSPEGRPLVYSATQLCGGASLSGATLTGSNLASARIRVSSSVPFKQLRITASVSGSRNPSSPYSLLVICSESITPACTTPAVPTISTTAASCSTASSHSISNYNSSYTYSSSPSGLSISSTGVITGGVGGTTYSITASAGAGCSATSATFTKQDAYPTPLAPVARVTAPATCTSDSKHTLNVYNPNYTYSSVPSGLIFSATGEIENAVNGTNYIITATSSMGCTSSASFTQTPAQNPPTPSINTTAASCSSASSHSISNYNSSYTYSSSPSGLTISNTGVITGGVSGTSYSITASAGAG